MIASTSVDEDRRRRTIIVEKRKGSYGFTLQSYGIHYQKEREVEMITYVDHVEYDGAAYRAGMREGDVILSINGTDMENADHKTLVNFIKKCDNRMRMVVLFENCVRKVELHMRYIQLQEILQNKMAELEGVVLKEKEILEGKWKTHSLPARKKATDNMTEISPSSDHESSITLPYIRPLSTEDVAKLSKQQQNQIIPPPAQFILAYQYLDPYHKHIIKSSTPNSSGEYLVSNASSLSRSQNNTFMSSNENNSFNFSNTNPMQHHHHHHHTQDTIASLDYSILHHQKQQHTDAKAKSNRRHYHVGHSCNPCMGHFIKREKSADKDNTSLDAYDLASPCCEPNCVPVKRRSRHHKDHHHHHKHKHRDKERPPRPRSQSHASPQMQNNVLYSEDNNQHQEHPVGNYDVCTQLANQCSLHSCSTSNDFCQRTAIENPGYTSHSPSNDTLWDSKSEQLCNRQVFKQRPNSAYHPSVSSNTQSYVHRYIHPSQVQPMQNAITTTHAYIPPQYNHRPKSWDNLAANKNDPSTNYAIGGVSNNGYMKHHHNNNGEKQKQQQLTQNSHVLLQRKSGQAPYGRYSAFAEVENYVPAPQAFVQAETITKTTIITTTKSTENLINNAQYNISDENCECISSNSQQQQCSSKPIITSSNCAACNSTGNLINEQSYQGYYSNLRNNNQNRYIPTKTEITRL
ncbi:hypothetical protein PVAND_006698 [Polypedilum vanderplanki]|uniref:PDZ domain-containing protein n=1 Tax=Polypedilum vanderplanki TaxID=319348 RepID=A0A9J6C5N2_POLVA|nr:hypothetical protein PVAND_006698 [Polypedilum vanderplanki]